MTFSDYFSGVASSYASFRPRYPESLFTWLATVAPGKTLAWDCGAGSGQASEALARNFRKVIATDASAEQIAAARPHPEIEYRVARAEESGIAAATVDLITVAQALHWFDLPRFYAEVRRVSVPRGVIAVWTYNVLHVASDPAIDALLQNFYWHVAAPYWPAERKHVDNGYADLPFPFEPIQAPAFDMTSEWSLPELLGYTATWSAVSRMKSAIGAEPFEQFAGTLRALWGEETERRQFAFPLALHIGRV